MSLTNHKIVIATGNANRWIGRCIASIRSQTCANFECVVMDNSSTDGTGPAAQAAIADDARFRLIREERRQEADLDVQSMAIEMMQPRDEDVIVMVGGADWLANNRVLATLSSYYSDSDCWLTYGTPLVFHGDRHQCEPSWAIGPFSRDDLNAGRVRSLPWAATQLHTFRYGLWRSIDRANAFYDDQGRLWSVAADRAAMFPMLEMAGDRARYVPEITVVQNRTGTKEVPRDPHREEQQRQVEMLLRARPPYARLADDVLSVRVSEGKQPRRHAIYRIWPGRIRSPEAFWSWRGLPIIDVPAVSADKPANFHSRERACSRSHAAALGFFLSTDASHCVVIEDDVKLIERSWLCYDEFDYFVPFSRSRACQPGEDLSVRKGVLPRYGALAYVASRRFAEAYIPLLSAGRVADHANHRAARGLRVGSYASGAVVHDNDAVSMVSEKRQRRYRRCAR